MPELIGTARPLSGPCGRRATLLFAAAAAVGAARDAAAQPRGDVAMQEQARLLAKIVSYDRNFAARAIDRAKLLLVAHRADPAAAAAIHELARAFAALSTVGGLPHSEEIVAYADAPTVAETCNSHRISIVYFGPGLDDQIEDIRRALASVDVLSVASVAAYVPRGIVLGFCATAEGARPILNRAQARTQNVVFGARILSRMTIYE